MFRSCLLALLLYVVIAVGYFFWLDTVFDRPGSYWDAAGLGFVVFCCVGALMNAKLTWTDWSLASATRHQFPPGDGRVRDDSSGVGPARYRRRVILREIGVGNL